MNASELSHAPRAQLRLDEGFFAANNNLRLYWRSMSPPGDGAARASVAVVHGYGDHSGRYREVLERLAGQGFSAHAFDYRGHGQSDGRRAFCQAFSEYIDDLEVFLAHVKQKSDGKKIFLIAHSLGGLIALRWALGRREGVDGLLLCSPFLGFAFTPPRFKVLAAHLLDGVWPWAPVGSVLKPEQLTRDTAIQRATARDPLYLHVATPRWFLESERAQAHVAAHAGELTMPCLVALGTADPIADPTVTRAAFSRFGSSDKTLRSYEGLLHELLNELERDRVMQDLTAWIEAHL